MSADAAHRRSAFMSDLRQDIAYATETAIGAGVARVDPLIAMRGD
jgi:hypothetical protein